MVAPFVEAKEKSEEGTPFACHNPRCKVVNRSARPKLPAVSEQMKAWSAALEAEFVNWPRVSL
jgi:hypothetical protein